MIKNLHIKGLRGFNDEQTLELAIPNGNDASGLTILVGPNNGGKSTIIEAIQAISSKSSEPPSFSVGKRNIRSGDSILIRISDEDSNALQLKSINPGASETEYVEQGLSSRNLNVFVLQSRRNFDSYFSKGTWDRETFLANNPIGARRSVIYSNFPYRLFQIQKDPNEFNRLLYQILHQHIEWRIDLSESEQYFLKLIFDTTSHSSDGAGEGLISIFTILDALYDSKPKNTIVIDEPELSLHPAYQRRLLHLLSDYSKDRQIIIATHSPYFINWEGLLNGGKIARIINKGEGTQIHQLTDGTTRSLKGLLSNLFNPHILGLNANEVFFLDDGIILTEGQEDVIYYKKIAQLLGIEIDVEFFGWGVGGAGNMAVIIAVLHELGFEKISIIFDSDKTEDLEGLKAIYSQYNFKIIPTHDVRDKEEVKPRAAIEGLIDKGGKKVKTEHEAHLREIFNEINQYTNNGTDDVYKRVDSKEVVYAVRADRIAKEKTAGGINRRTE